MLMNNTTRRYPRTEAEAFRGADYANAFWRLTPKRTSKMSNYLWIAAGVFLVVVMLAKT